MVKDAWKNPCKAALSTKTTEIENKMPHTTTFITTPEFIRLTKVNFDARMKQELKGIASKSQLDAALDMANKNREKIKKLQTFKLF